MPRTSERAKATERPSERAKATERALLNHSVLRCDRARLRAALNGARTVATMPTGRSVDGSGAPEVVLLRGDSHAAARWAMAASDGARGAACSNAVCVLDFASDSRPGGGWRGDQRGTQEEALCRASSLGLALERATYPIPEQGAVVVPDVALLAASPREECVGWCAVIAAALREADGDAAYIARKIAGVLRCAAAAGHAALVGGAWGCGAFGNAADDVARGWRSALESGAGAGLRLLALPIPARSPHWSAFREAFPSARVVELDAAAAAAAPSSPPASPPSSPPASPPPPPPPRARRELSDEGRRLFLESTEPPKSPSDGFAKYPKMAEGLGAGFAGGSGGEWLVTEKVHGANFSVVLARGARPGAPPSVAFAKRTGVLDERDDFYSVRSSGLAAELAAAAPALWEAAAAAGRDELVGLQLFGELFGGHYPHADVAAATGLAPVQRGVWYCPELRFLGFDLRVETAAGERRFLDFADAAACCAAARVPFAQPRATGSLAACLEYPIEFESGVPALFGLPPIAGNFAEGVVVRPAREPKASDRGLFKRKIPQFSETRYANNGWRDAKRGGGGGAAGGGGPSDEEIHGFEILARVTPPRLAAVMSKLGRVTPDEPERCRELLRAFKADVREDLAATGGDDSLAALRASASLRSALDAAARELILAHFRSERRLSDT